MISKNIFHGLVQRESNDDRNLDFQRSNHVTLDHINRLGLQSELEGHQGCVNCLSWNQGGNLLLSGSDDARVIVWDAFNHNSLCSIDTGHNGNIFSAKFMPNGLDNLVISGAGDSQIRVHDVTSKSVMAVLHSHKGRVKRLAVTPDQPHLFWSTSEDGTVMQFDLRDADTLSNKEQRCLLIDLKKHMGPQCEIKCLNINPAFSEQLAIGANDPYARVYDRRMLQCRLIDSARSTDDDHVDSLKGCVDYYVAGHLSKRDTSAQKGRRTLASTYVAFSPDGRELLVNLGGEQAYIFDVNNKRRREKLDLIPRGGIIPSGGGGIAGGDTDSKGMDDYSIGEDKGDGDKDDKVIPKSPNGVANGLRKSPSPDLSSIHPSPHLSTSSSSSSSLSSHQHTYTPKRSNPLNPRQREMHELLVENMRQRAGEYFEKGNYTQAINFYNQAIILNAHSSVLHCNRAIALYKRAWDGDVYAAVRDCYAAILLEDLNFKAHYRLVKCLVALDWLDEAKSCLEIVHSKFTNSTELVSLDHQLKTANKKFKDKNQSQSSMRLQYFPSGSEVHLSELEKMHQDLSFDYDQRFCGHCNTTTDIKEANFFGSNGQFVVAGSDDGSFFIWHRKTSNIVRILNGDSSIVNCLEPHPTSCVLATSGIESVVRLWGVQDGSKCDREVTDSDIVAQANQTRMNLDPLELVLLSMGYRISAPEPDERPANDNPSSPVYCRPS